MYLPNTEKPRSLLLWGFPVFGSISGQPVAAVNQQYLTHVSQLHNRTFISTKASLAHQLSDGWTLATKDGSFVAQHEHTIVVTDGQPLILTEANSIWE